MNDNESYNNIVYIGPSGAERATLTSMIGSSNDKLDFVEKTLKPLLCGTYTSRAITCGGIGSGMAVKSINNILNTAHCLVAAEGLLALKKFGVSPDVALDVINSSSGRSLATEVRIPMEVLTGKFGFGFALSLMAKDCRIASQLLSENFPQATLLQEVNKLINEAETSTDWGSTADYSAVIKLLEERSGTDLRSNAK